MYPSTHTHKKPRTHIYRHTDMHTDTHIQDLLQLFTDCSPAIPTMTVYQWKVQLSISCYFMTLDASVGCQYTPESLRHRV